MTVLCELCSISAGGQDSLNIGNAAGEMYSFERLSEGSSLIHSRHSLVKLISTLVLIISVVSFGRYEVGRLVPYVFYPVIIAALSGTPWKPLGKRAALALPFVLFAGISNIIFDRGAAVTLGAVTLSYGMLSCLSLLFRAFLCVAAVMLLVATTPLRELVGQLRRLHTPDIFVTIFEMTYRYIGTLLDEASTMYTAYMLRSPDRKGLEMKHMGSFTGQLLIRSFDRAERVYNAMKCRGYALRQTVKIRKRLIPADYIYLAATCIPCVALRLFDIPALYSKLWEALL